MAQGISDGISLTDLVSVPKIWGKVVAKAVLAWIAAKCIFPMLSLF